MKYEDLVELIFILLERIQKGDLTTDQEPMLRNAMRDFFMKRKGYTDGEFFGDSVKGLMSDMTIWALEQKGDLVRKKVEAKLISQCQMIKELADRERRRRAVYTLAPLMVLKKKLRRLDELTKNEIAEAKESLKTEATPEHIFEIKQQTQKEIDEASIKAVQDFERLRGEMVHLTEPEWLFMKRLPVTDPLWEFLGLVGMESFSIFFHDWEAFTIKMPSAEKIDRVRNQKPPTDKEFVKQVNIWIRQQTSHNLFKK